MRSPDISSPHAAMDAIPSNSSDCVGPITSKDSSRGAFQAVQNAMLAPFVAVPNIGLATMNSMLEQTAAMTGSLAEAAEKAKLLPYAEVVVDSSRRAQLTAKNAAEKSFQLVRSAARVAMGHNSDTTVNRLLAETVIDRGAAAVAMPLLLARDSFGAAADSDSLGPKVWGVGLSVSKYLDRTPRSQEKPGVLTGAIGDKTAASERWGFSYMVTEGPAEAILKDVRGMIGGLIALSLGDSTWLAEGVERFHGSMFYVYDKKQNGEAQPESDLPIGKVLAEHATKIIDNFPFEFAQALGTGDYRKIVRAYGEQREQVNTLFRLYLPATYRVAADVTAFLYKAMFDVRDAQKFALCELAIMESGLSDKEKDEALGTLHPKPSGLRPTAPNTTIEFEFYVPLLIPLGGNANDKQSIAHRSDAAGNPVHEGTTEKGVTAVSIFNQNAINIAQSVNSELFSFRSFLWLYRDEQKAREANYRETVRKFGARAADRIVANPRYALQADEIAELTKAGPRPQAEIHEEFDTLLRGRSTELAVWADRIKAAWPNAE